MIRCMLTRDSAQLDGHAFLHPAEEEEGKHFRHPGRHRQWLLGRAAAKTLLQRHASENGLPPPRPPELWVRRTEEGWPEPLTKEGRALPVSLTISHTADLAFCALCPAGEGTVGADMERVEPRSEAFLEDYYTEVERDTLRGLTPAARDQATTVLWCIKEAVLKALRTGLNMSPLLIEVRSLGSLTPHDWRRAEVQLVDGSTPQVFWCMMEHDTIALAVARLRQGEEHGIHLES